MAKLTELQSLCLSYVDQLSTTNARVLAEAMAVEVKTVQRVLRTQGVKEAMLERARDKLAIAALDAANTITRPITEMTSSTRARPRQRTRMKSTGNHHTTKNNNGPSHTIRRAQAVMM